MSNEIEEKYKVYYRYVDKDGNEIPETHVLPKKYKLYGRAWSYAHKELCKEGDPRVHISIHFRDPWKNYYRDDKCEFCGKDMKIMQGPEGYDMIANYLSIRCRDLQIKDAYRTFCDECGQKIANYIKSLKK